MPAKTPRSQSTLPKRPREGLYKKALREAHEQSQKITMEYMRGRDIPEWFRGTSNFQGKAASRLNESLLYDLEQRTSHRVRSCLVGLGLNPIIKNDEIKFLIKISRANDLAFLWFLYELHYKQSKPQYSINEQLILSAIAHLDMIPTLRELDRILPPGPKGLPEPPKKRRRTQLIRVADIPNFESPYLKPIRLPKPYSAEHKRERKEFEVALGEYDLWKDPNYVVPNEANRWFAEYEPQTGRRVVQKTLNETIENIFENYAGALERAMNTTVLYEHHRQRAGKNEQSEVELQIKARDECLKYFDVDGAKKAHVQARIKAQIERDVDMYLGKFQKCPKKSLTKHSKAKEGKAEEKAMVLEGVDSFRYHHIRTIEEDIDACYERGSYRTSNPETIGYHAIGTFDGFTKRERERGGQEITHLSMSQPNARTSKWKEESDVTLSPTTSNVFFVAAQKNQPWRFDYQKVFHLNHANQPPEDVKQQLVKAVDSEMSFRTKIECLSKPNVDKAVNAAVKRSWHQAVKAYNAKHPNVEALTANESAVEQEEKIPLDFGRDTFDPNDKELMSQMLKTAFEYMKKNRKLVLASLPDAHKLPSFVYFIENRYGKRYSLRDRQRLYLKSQNIIRALEKLTKRIPMPRLEQFCANTFVSYACREYLLAKANRIRQEYYERLDDAIMRQARVLWFAMRPYLCNSGPPKNTYFAYMPSRIVDITRFRQWKSSEFMNAKLAWDQRQREARLKVFK